MSNVKYVCRSVGLANYSIQTPIGLLNLKSCNEGVHSLQFDESVENEVHQEVEKQEVCFAKTDDNLPKANSPALQTLDWLKTYFENPENAKVKSMPKICFLQDEFKVNKTKIFP